MPRRSHRFEINSVYSVKILLCYLLEKLDRPVTEEELRIIAEDSGVINYFFLSDALDELVKNGSVAAEVPAPGQRILTVTEKGKMGAEYFNRNISRVFRRRILETAFAFFMKKDREAVCDCNVSECGEGFNVSFRLKETGYDLINMSFYAPDIEQAELIAEKIRSNPMGAYRQILTFLLETEEEKADVEKMM
ncbi:MAG: DUF4364 family protein [Oscillospiraceae bacterium]|nr:DUF4364 family protein [Oscillospiraceae bacterium]